MVLILSGELVQSTYWKSPQCCSQILSMDWCSMSLKLLWMLKTPDHKLRKNARLSWETSGFRIDSRVHEFEPDNRIGWFGDGNRVHAYHTFYLEKTSEGCHTITEEVVKGPGAI